MNSIEKKVFPKEKFGGVSISDFNNKKSMRDNLVVFDFDETLVKSSHVFLQMNRTAMRMLELPHDDYVVARIYSLRNTYIGWGKDIEEQKKIYDEKFSPLVTKLSNEPYFYQQMRFVAGMKDIVLNLAKIDLNLAIASSRDIGSILKFLELEGMRDKFCIIEATEGGKNFEDKPSTQMVEYISEEVGVPLKNSIMIGDTSGDIIMGKNAGMKTVAIGFGAYAKPEQLMEHIPNALLYKEENVKALPSIINGLVASMNAKVK